jgi:hypothetical protein
MKPKPFSALKNFTVPVATRRLFQSRPTLVAVLEGITILALGWEWVIRAKSRKDFSTGPRDP